jgi:hypothetical protein
MDDGRHTLANLAELLATSTHAACAGAFTATLARISMRPRLVRLDVAPDSRRRNTTAPSCVADERASGYSSSAGGERTVRPCAVNSAGSASRRLPKLVASHSCNAPPLRLKKRPSSRQLVGPGDLRGCACGRTGIQRQGALGYRWPIREHYRAASVRGSELGATSTSSCAQLAGVDGGNVALPWPGGFQL